MIRNTFVITALVVASLGIATSNAQTPATADACYGTAHFFDINNVLERVELISVDVSSGTGATVGDTGILERLSALAIDSNGDMYAATSEGDIYRVDAGNGTATFLSSTGLIFTAAMAFDEDDNLFAFADNPLSSTGASLWSVDPLTGSATDLVEIQELFAGMAFDPETNVMYASTGGSPEIIEAVYTVDQSDGSVTFAGNTGTGNSIPDIAFNSDAELFLMTGGGSAPNTLYSMDKSSGAAASVGGTGFTVVSGFDCFAQFVEEPPECPTAGNGHDDDDDGGHGDDDDDGGHGDDDDDGGHGDDDDDGGHGDDDDDGRRKRGDDDDDAAHYSGGLAAKGELGAGSGNSAFGGGHGDDDDDGGHGDDDDSGDGDDDDDGGHSDDDDSGDGDDDDDSGSGGTEECPTPDDDDDSGDGDDDDSGDGDDDDSGDGDDDDSGDGDDDDSGDGDDDDDGGFFRRWWSRFGKAGDAGQVVPDEHALIGNYPNPFNPTTNITFTLKESAYVVLSVYNVNGQEVRRLATGTRAAGIHTVVWDATDEFGQSVSSGLYLYRLSAGDYVSSRKMLLLE